MSLLMKLLTKARDAMCAGIWVALDAKDAALDWFFEPMRERRQIRYWWLNRSAKLKAQGYSFRDARRLHREWDEQYQRQIAERRGSANPRANGG